MVNSEDLNNKRVMSNIQETRKAEETKNETRSNQINDNSQEILTSPIYTSAFLRTQIGKLMRIEFLIGTNNMVERVGFLEDVGANYILLKSFEGDSQIYADINAIKFITISTSYAGMTNYQNMNNFNNTGMQNMNSGMSNMYNMNRYY